MLRATMRAIQMIPAILAGAWPPKRMSRDLLRRLLTCIDRAPPSGRLRCRPHESADDPEERQRNAKDEHDPVSVADRVDPKRDQEGQLDKSGEASEDEPHAFSFVDETGATPARRLTASSPSDDVPEHTAS